MKTVQKIISLYAIIAIIAPSFYFGLLPPKEVHAQNIGEIIAGGVVSALECELSKLGDYLGDILGSVTDIFSDYFDFDFTSILDMAGSNFGLGGLFGGSAEDSVPTKETNAEMLKDIATTAEATTEAVFKECVLDPIVWVIKKLVISMLTEQILDWLNEGHDGAAVFITDLAKYLIDINEESVRAFFHDNDELGHALRDWLCGPFSDQVANTVEHISRQPTFGESGDSVCTILDKFSGTPDPDATYREIVAGNIDMENVGITGAMALIQDGNNPYSAFFNVQAEAAYRVKRFAAEQLTYLAWGNGYLPDKKEPEGQEGAKRLVVTPGKFIATQIDNWANGALSELEAADEVAEIIDAIFSALITDIFHEDGLLNSGESDHADEREQTAQNQTEQGNVASESAGSSARGQCSTAIVRDPINGDVCDQSLDHCCQDLCRRCALDIGRIGASWPGRLNGCVRGNDCRAGN
jgi:hypothetical protein